MRIVVLVSYARALILFRLRLIGEMVAAGHEVIACAPGRDAAVADALAALGARYRAVALSRTGLNPAADARDLVGLVRLFRELRPDLVLACTAKPVIYGGLAAALTGVPRRFAMIEGLGYAFTEGREWRRRALRRVLSLLYRMSLTRADGIFFLNPDDRALFEQLGLVRGPEQAVMINGIGIDLDAFRPAPLPPGPPSFLLIARLLRDKGVREYVDAARTLRTTYSDATFRLVGWLDEGNPASITERELRSWVEEGAVEYLGRLDDVRPAIAAASVYVLPSYYREGTPRTVLEAMAMGRPVVTTDAPGCRETVRDGVNGYLVPVRDVGALTRAMERFLVEPGLIGVMGRESRRIAVEKYDVRKVNAVMLRAMGLLPAHSRSN